MIPPRPRQANRVPPIAAGPGRRLRLLSPRLLRARIVLAFVLAKHLLLPWLLATWHRRSLEHRAGPGAAAAPAEPVVVSSWYGNAALLDAFLAHHRRLGLAEFVLLDLSQQGGLHRLVAGEAGCAVWRPRGPIDSSRAVYWLNYLRRRYGSGRWVLSLEPYDLFVYYRCETRRIGDLLDFLASEHRNHLYGVVVEMYGEHPAAALRLQPGECPLRTLALFDPLGYEPAEPGPNRSVVVRGGVQRRALFAGDPRRSPALNRVPLIRWQPSFAYLAGTRLAMPRRLNTPHSPWHASPTACLLRVALLDDEAGLAVAACVEGVATDADAGAPSIAGVAALRRMPLRQDSSRRYGSTEDLVACGLLSPGQWF